MENVSILYEDNDILVLDKPVGIIVNTSMTSGDNTLQELVAQGYPELFDETSEDDFHTRNGLVHRLDKDTSGVLLFAKSKEAFDYLTNQFKERQVKKEYAALVLGEIMDDNIEIRAPIGRSPKAKRKMAVVEGGRESVTIVEKLHTASIDNQQYTWIKVLPKTGRTHQIRVHLAALNHPVVGDILYEGKRRGITSREEFGRLMLHAHKLTIRHPRTEKNITLEAPLPSEFSH